MRAEIEGLLCSGVMQGKEATWALLSERVPATTVIPLDEALKRLAQKYFRSHSPASLEDFTWWSGLPKMQCKKAIEGIASELEEVSVEVLQCIYIAMTLRLLITQKQCICFRRTMSI
ncbi:DNA glycosylase AlkZ-like family protein [Capnocytophaga ochracea]|uniref:DNA glycosylase AlkZ-like family protein n=1 Tax=Capnocytophaga ochracea TaxID=1018 RepID=UPI00209224F8|nr:crosslink repair DNA glycosylase YcaQ family protein [Capnocytophaga ochracea]